MINAERQVLFSPDLEEVDTGYTIQTDFNLDETEWEVLQMHWHSPSEHTVDFNHYDAELHIVHHLKGEHSDGHGDIGALLVVGLFFEIEGSDAGYSDAFLEGWDFENMGQDEVTIPTDFFLNELPNKKFWHYEGSLTTPECNEIVSWYVMEHVNKIHEDQLNAMIAAFGRENN